MTPGIMVNIVSTAISLALIIGLAGQAGWTTLAWVVVVLSVVGTLMKIAGLIHMARYGQ